MLGGVGGEVLGQQREFLETIRSSSEKVLALINDMLDAAKLESGEFKVEKKPGNLTALVAQSIKSVYSIAEKQKITLKFEGEKDPRIAIFDEQRMSQVFVNLINNSIKFSPEGTEIDIGFVDMDPTIPGIPKEASAILKEHRSAVVFVRDHGAGIEAVDQSKIFNRFFQANDPEVKKHKGTGLGLSICRSIVEAHGGAIWFKSEGKGKGTVFYVLVPME
jgi:signal transduction histidine kinase